MRNSFNNVVNSYLILFQSIQVFDANFNATSFKNNMKTFTWNKIWIRYNTNTHTIKPCLLLYNPTANLFLFNLNIVLILFRTQSWTNTTARWFWTVFKVHIINGAFRNVRHGLDIISHNIHNLCNFVPTVAPSQVWADPTFSRIW